MYQYKCKFHSYYTYPSVTSAAAFAVRPPPCSERSSPQAGFPIFHQARSRRCQSKSASARPSARAPASPPPHRPWRFHWRFSTSRVLSPTHARCDARVPVNLICQFVQLASSSSNFRVKKHASIVPECSTNPRSARAPAGRRSARSSQAWSRRRLRTRSGAGCGAHVLVPPPCSSWASWTLAERRHSAATSESASCTPSPVQWVQPSPWRGEAEDGK